MKTDFDFDLRVVEEASAGTGLASECRNSTMDVMQFGCEESDVASREVRLRINLVAAREKRVNPMAVIRSLGIEYKHWVDWNDGTIGECVILKGCTKVPKELPIFIDRVG